MEENKLKDFESLSLKVTFLEKQNKELKENLHKTQEEFEKIFLKKNFKKISTNFKVVTTNQRYGAEIIVRSSLPYRLGATVIKDTKSIRRIPRLPFDLLEEFKYKDVDNQEKRNLEGYYDYQRAVKLKDHLSYKVGLCIIDSVEHPIRAPLLPFRLVFELYKFKSK